MTDLKGKFFFCKRDQLDILQLILELYVEDFKNNPTQKYMVDVFNENEWYLILIDNTGIWSYCRINSLSDQEFATKNYSENYILLNVEDILKC